MSNLTLPGFSDDSPESMDSLREQAMACTRCRLHETRTRVTWSQGDANSPLMVVGMGPSVTDDRTDGIYSGPAGDDLDAVLEAAGISREVIYLTNAHKCVARKKGDSYNIRQPTKTELRACKDWLDSEFRLVKPRVLLAIGSATAKWLLGESFDLTEQRGQWVDGPFATRATATFQPNYATRLRPHDPPKADEIYAQIVEDFTSAAREASLIDP
jgi:DNA polymerase